MAVSNLRKDRRADARDDNEFYSDDCTAFKLLLLRALQGVAVSNLRKGRRANALDDDNYYQNNHEVFPYTTTLKACLNLSNPDSLFLLT